MCDLTELKKKLLCFHVSLLKSEPVIYCIFTTIESLGGKL